MIADHTNRVLIGTPAKTGCTSLEFSIRYRDDVPDGLEVVHWDTGRRANKMPHGLIVPGDCERYTRYMTVRHPLDRIVSLYFHLRKPYHQGHEWPGAAEDLARLDKFNDFVPWWLDQRAEHGFGQRDRLLPDGSDQLAWWLQPNIWLITLGECYKVFGYPHLIRLESYEADLKAINPYWGKVPHRMKSGVDTSWRDHFNKTNIKKVLKDHADEDLELLDYDI